MIAVAAAAAGDGGEEGGGGGGDGSPNHSVRWFGKATWLTGSCLSPPAALYILAMTAMQRKLQVLLVTYSENFCHKKMENNQEDDGRRFNTVLFVSYDVYLSPDINALCARPLTHPVIQSS